MNYDQICDEIKNKRSYLCIGLDSDLDKIPKHLLKYKDPIFEFNKLVVDATKDIVIAYKPNLAFYEVLGFEGIKTLQKTTNYIPDNIFKIADAKRGDIGNTSIMYAKTFFETLNFDAVTLSPYMGKDSVDPYLEYKNKWAIILALTSNESAKEIQLISSNNGEKLYESVINDSLKWSTSENLMYVVGANRDADLFNIRKIIPDSFILIPGVGAQGGDLKKISNAGMNKNCGIMVNVSRSIIYSDNSTNFQDSVRKSALNIQKEMEQILLLNNII
ncbi:MAG: orotidine-5'-phosphate decarboxylase [Flammeovirgaceae bacterium TMED290]|nr:MAG: orotidine-5'-phosphate decarboxylase [Flammeovirgaceae bacterium TMED290]|tara:strand:- start:4299 stop:5120 length:822 start_codon:yes stop_codon:yes gene_type:complete